MRILKQAQLQVKSLAVNPPVVLPGREATVTAEVTNVGEDEGDLLVSMMVDGVEADNRPLLLKPGAIESVSFSVVKDSPGTYQISIGDLSTRMTVPELETYKSEVFLYSISFPADWTINVDEADQTAVSFEAPGFRGEVLVGLSPASTNVDEEYDKFLAGTENNIPGYTVLVRMPLKEDDEVVGYSFEAEFPIEGEKIRSLSSFTKKGRWSWFRSMETFEVHYETNKHLFLTASCPPLSPWGRMSMERKVSRLRFHRLGWLGNQRRVRGLEFLISTGRAFRKTWTGSVSPRGEGVRRGYCPFQGTGLSQWSSQLPNHFAKVCRTGPGDTRI